MLFEIIAKPNQRSSPIMSFIESDLFKIVIRKTIFDVNSCKTSFC